MSENAWKWYFGTCHFLGWFVVNVFIATSPIWISYFFPLFTKERMLFSFLAYAFTFLIGGIYVFWQTGRRFYSPERLQLLFFLVIALVFGFAYVSLNYDSEMMRLVEKHSKVSIFLILSITTISGTWLYWEKLWSQIHQEVTDKQKELAGIVRDDVRGMKGNIDKGGNAND